MTTRRGACAMWMRLLVLLPVEIAIAGCGATPATPPPFELGQTKIVKEGDPAAQHGAAYSIRITSPQEGTRFSQGDKIEVVCELTVPDGGTMPTSVNVDLLGKQERIHSSTKPRPEKHDGGNYSLTGRLTCPKQTGTFKIVAKGADTVLLLPSGRSDEKKIPSKDRFSNRTLTSAPVTVRVK